MYFCDEDFIIVNLDPHVEAVRANNSGDYKTAFQIWLSLAKDDGHCTAEYNLGRLYDGGHGIPQSISEAIYWYKSSALKGHPEAQLNLGTIYLKGNRVARDLPKAKVFLSMASLQGCAPAQHNFGLMFCNKEFLPIDIAEAYVWLTLSFNSGFKEAKSKATFLKKLLSPLQRQKAKYDISLREKMICENIDILNKARKKQTPVA